MGRAEDIIKAYEAWDPDQESATELASRLGISKARLYQVLEEEGVDVAVVSAILGHASPAFTMSVYQHVREGMAEQAADAIERAFGQ